MNNIQKSSDNMESFKTIKDKTNKRVFKQYVIHSFIIYTIYNLENNRYYIGYSTNGEEWKDSHSTKLETGNSDIIELQQDYNSMKARRLDVEKYIIFDVKKTLYICGVYTDRFVENIRREFFDMEQSMIWEAFDKGHNLYNNNPSKFSENTIDENLKSRTSGIEFTIEGTLYKSLAKAAKAMRKSIDFIKYRLDRPEEFPDYKFATPSEKKGQRIARAVIYKGKSYKSISVCRKETGIHYDTTVANCDNELNTDFKWGSKKQSENSNQPRSVSVKGEKCDSLNDAVKYRWWINTRTSIRNIKNRCDDPEDTDYYYLD